MELFAKVVGARVGAKPTGRVRVRWVLSVRPACWAWVEFWIDFRPFRTANLAWDALYHGLNSPQRFPMFQQCPRTSPPLY